MIPLYLMGFQGISVDEAEGVAGNLAGVGKTLGVLLRRSSFMVTLHH